MKKESENGKSDSEIIAILPFSFYSSTWYSQLNLPTLRRMIHDIVIVEKRDASGNWKLSKALKAFMEVI